MKNTSFQKEKWTKKMEDSWEWQGLGGRRLNYRDRSPQVRFSEKLQLTKFQGITHGGCELFPTL